MEKGVLGVICGAIGAAIGSVATYFISKNRIENSVREELEGTFRKAQDELNEFYKTNFEPKREPVKDSILMQNAYKKAEEKRENIAKMGLEERETEDKLRVKSDEEARDYTKFYEETGVGKEESDGSEYEFYEEYGGGPDGKYPRIISRSEFLEPNGNVKLKLIYYEESAVFAHAGDSTDSGFTEEYFGLQNLSEFGNYKYDDGETDDYTLFFRNDADGTDFEVYYDPYETYDEVLAKEGKLIDG